AKLVLVRHGETAWTTACRFTGQTNVPLTETGHAQARAVAREIAAMTPCVVASSDLERAVQTAESIAQAAAVAVATDARLREEYLGPWEGLSRDEVASLF